ncbi:hypothetical protein PENFLA_c023G08397 [Penicillium flavigenum]|uniref:Xylanolytic transcriptional activator regulatory domain-containing protein n=1 Tax=Penicillium flavigenum TaxID=254877 RepID=A0A1V6SUG2_9EURO|nr:hypothetical protein PENFLA_c023G08397 [Penicillium flavigenum]
MVTMQRNRRLSGGGSRFSQPQPSCEPCVPATDDAANEPSYYRNLLYDVFEGLRSASHQQKLLQMIQHHTPMQQIRIYLDEILADAQVHEKNEKKPSELKKMGHEIRLENDTPRFRPRSMDIRYLCDSPPYRVPAKPWTSVTDDDDLVSHLISLYMTWDYPFYAFFDREAFLEHMTKGNLNSDFCSPFLVNALLANACDYSQYNEAYTIPGDVKTKGADFLAEAESYVRVNSFERGNGIRLATLQATLLLYERYSTLGNEDFGYTMLHRAIEMAEGLGIVNHKRLDLNSSQMSEEMTRSVKRTAWGLFQVDTIVHTNFLKPSRVNEVTVDRIQRGVEASDETWTPYPISSYTRPSYLNIYFDEACNLSYISRDISRSVQIAQQAGFNPNEVKQENYNRLCQWEANLPSAFNPRERPAPHILLLRMRYHVLVINLCCDAFDYYSSCPNLEERPPKHWSPKSAYSPVQAAVSSAREISTLSQLMRTEYGMEYGHQFTMYALNVALYTLLDQPTFDILDSDFLRLTSAFSFIASRSPVGKSLFNFFKSSVRTQNQGKKPRCFGDIPREIRAIFWHDSKSPSPDKWDQMTRSENRALNMERLEDNPQLFSSSGLKEMIGEYEKLSMGKEELPHGQRKGDDF